MIKIKLFPYNPQKKNPLAQEVSMLLQEDKFTFVRRDIKFYTLREDGEPNFLINRETGKRKI